jgi:hypothetical protein
VDGHELTECYNTAKILREYKAKRSQGSSNTAGQGNPNPPGSNNHGKSKLAKAPKPPAKASRTSAATLGGHNQPPNDESNYSGSEYKVTSRNVVCLLSSSTEPLSAGDLNLDLGCLMTMVPDANLLMNLKTNTTPIHLDDQSEVKETNKGLLHLPLAVKKDVKALVVPALHKPLLSIANLCDNDLRVVFNRSGCDILTSDGSQTVVGKGYPGVTSITYQRDL